MLRLLLEARDMTEELLHALFRFRPLPFADQNDRAWVQRVAAFAGLRNALPAKAALILKIIWVDLGHTI